MPIIVQEIGTNKYIINEYTIVDMHLQGLKNRKSAVAILYCEDHLVKDFKANFLIENDILGSEKVKIDLEKDETHLGSCQVTILLSIKNKSMLIHKPIYLKKPIVISFHTVLLVPIHSFSAIPLDRDYIFKPNEKNFSLYTHMINSETRIVLVKNNEDRSIKISRNLYLRYIIEIDYANIYYTGDIFSIITKININLSGVDVTTTESFKVDFTDQDNLINQDSQTNLACNHLKSNHKKSWFKKVLVACAMVVIATISMTILAILFIFSKTLLSTIKRDVYTTMITLEVYVFKKVLKNAFYLIES